VVDFAGHPAEIDTFRKICDKYNLFLIEDAAHSIGSLYKNRPVGSLTDLTTFSFFPTKNITTGEGGAVSSPDPELLAKAKSFSRQGLVRDPNKFRIKDEGPWHQEVHEFGLNYRLSDVLCALGISQLGRISQFKEIRMNIFNSYGSLLSHTDNLRIPIMKSLIEPMWHLYPIRVKTDSRKRVFEGLRTSGIGVQVNYLPAHLHPIFTKYGHVLGEFPTSESFYSQEISLPMHVEISKNEIDYISETLLNLISNE
jgi:dTDP-4-amino-4,6-dideoxygalactose transaminase